MIINKMEMSKIKMEKIKCKTRLTNLKNNKNDIIYPIGLKIIYEKRNNFYFSYSYEMSTGNIYYMNSSIKCLSEPKISYLLFLFYNVSSAIFSISLTAD